MSKTKCLVLELDDGTELYFPKDRIVNVREGETDMDDNGIMEQFNAFLDMIEDDTGDDIYPAIVTH